ncbi:N-acetyltransferase family protein [Methylomagnum sp.]
MSILIRPAEPRDVDGMVALLKSLFGIEADFAFDESRQRAGLRLLLQRGNGHVLVAEREGRVVGMGSVQTVVSTAEGGLSGWVEDVVVAEDCQGQGIGRRLLERLEGWAIDHGVSRLQLLADRNNDAALRFYERMGWGGTALVALRKHPGRLIHPIAPEQALAEVERLKALLAKKEN